MATSSKVKWERIRTRFLYDPATKRVFTFNGRSQDSTAIDATNGTVLGTIKLDGKPEFAASDGKGEIFVNIEDKSELTAIDPNKLEVKAKVAAGALRVSVGFVHGQEEPPLVRGVRQQDDGRGRCRLRQSLATRPLAMAWTPPPSTTELGCFRIVRGRCAERNSRRFAGEIQRRGKRSHASRRAHHGARFQNHNVYVGDGEVRAASSGDGG